MAHPEMNLLALSMGMWAWQGRANKTLDLAKAVSPEQLEQAVRTMNMLGQAALFKFWNEDDPELKKEWLRVAKALHDGARYAS